MHFGENTMKINDLINENLNELFGLFGDADPIAAPEWLDDENKLLWQQKNPTEDNKRFVTQLRSIERDLVGNNLIDMANQQIKTELTDMMESVAETTSAGSVAVVGMPVGNMMSRQPRNSDGTARNALDMDNNLTGNSKKKKKKSSSSN